MFNPGFEPGTVCVLGRRDNHYTNWTDRELIKQMSDIDKQNVSSILKILEYFFNEW